jgi:two-component system sensor histidine kinase KdpD
LLVVGAPSLIGATLVVGYLQDELHVPNPSAIYLVAVVAAALVSGTAGAILTAVASFLLYNYLFTEPRYTLSMHEPGVWLSVVLLLFVGIVVGQLTALQRRRAETITTREREARALFHISRDLATRSSISAALDAIATRLAAEANMERLWITLGPDGDERVVAGTDPETGRSAHATGIISQLRRRPGDEAAEWVRLHRPAPAGRAATTAAAGAETLRVLIEAGDATLGSIWASRPRGQGPPDPTATRLLAAAADQLGQAITQERLLAEAQAAEIARQGDALKSALLQSVSHDLRTPLATIRAAAGTLGAAAASDEQRASAASIEREVEYLNRVVTNLLDLSRIEAGALQPTLDVFELDDVVRSTLERYRGRLSDRALSVELVDLPVLVDATLIDVVLANVLDNVIRHTPPTTALRVNASDLGDGRVRLTIEDAGPGVPAELVARVFDKFFTASTGQPASRHGTGIGLAVVRGLVEAMGGAVAARRGDLGGLAIDIDLPRAEVPAELAAVDSR